MEFPKMAPRTATRNGTPIYGSGEVASMTGLDPGVLANWLNRGIVELGTMVPEGKRKLRRFSIPEVLILAILAALTKQGLDISIAWKYIGAIQEGLLQGPGFDFIALSEQAAGVMSADATLDAVAGKFGGPAFIVVDMRAIRKAQDGVEVDSVNHSHACALLSKTYLGWS